MVKDVEQQSGELIIVNPMGLHARPASQLVSMANQYESEVWVARDGQEVNGKSILGVLMLACPMGSKVQLRCVGPDAQEAFKSLSSLVQDGFGELE